MNFKYILFIIFSSFFALQTEAQSIKGVWKTIDDEDGREKSHIEIYEENGKFRGKVIKLLPGASATHCSNCKGSLKNKPITGMIILWDLVKDGAEYGDGQILDPKSGKIYDCYVAFNGPDKLNVRGYIGFSLLGRTQTWYRVK
ncbi:MAG: DUF2147 domain-containing protein [Saprospiraceae bacterium]